MKFGGTSVADENCISNVADIVVQSHRDGNHVAVVVSAMKGVTDQLHSIAEEATTCKDFSQIEMFLQSLQLRHTKVLEVVAPSRAKESTSTIEGKFSNLRHILSSVYDLKELTPRSKDYIISFGERLSSILLSSALRERGINSRSMDGCEAGVITTEKHGNAIVLPESAYHIKSRIEPQMEGSVPVITGYMGCSKEGVITTLGRSGSDYSAAVIGSALDCDEIWIWTDVDGVMTADPRIINDARVLPTVSYSEAMELSYFGAEVLHPKSIEPAMQKGIPVRVKNTFNPGHPGTRIVKDEVHDDRVVKAITYIEQVALLNINGPQMIGRPGVLKTIFTALAEYGVNIMMISQGSSEANISLVIDEGQLNDALKAMAPCLNQCLVREITSDKEIVAMAVVGAGMAGTPGTGGKIFSALGAADINMMMISQGSSEVNISFVVCSEDGPKALRVLHNEFRLSEENF